MFLNKYKLSKTKSLEYVCLSANDIAVLESKSKHSQTLFLESSKTSSENMAGDLQSRIRGAGVDFEENKPYQAGSDSRNINWRTFARTQQLYVNIYNEDKRPSTYIVLDQRHEMYFGTRKQLKIKQALNFAIYSLFRAMHQQQNVSGVQIINKPKWHSVYSGSNSILSFIHELNTPLLSQQAVRTEPTLNDIINKLQLTDGTELVIISDFRDMNDETIKRLYHLSRKFEISLIRIQDPVEVELPKKGQFDIQNNIDSLPLHLNCNNKDVVETYKKIVHDKFSLYRTQCSNMGVNFISSMTTDEMLFE